MERFIGDRPDDAVLLPADHQRHVEWRLHGRYCRRIRRPRDKRRSPNHHSLDLITVNLDGGVHDWPVEHRAIVGPKNRQAEPEAAWRDLSACGGVACSQQVNSNGVGIWTLENTAVHAR